MKGDRRMLTMAQAVYADFAEDYLTGLERSTKCITIQLSINKQKYIQNIYKRPYIKTTPNQQSFRFIDMSKYGF